MKTINSRSQFGDVYVYAEKGTTVNAESVHGDVIVNGTDVTEDETYSPSIQYEFVPSSTGKRHGNLHLMGYHVTLVEGMSVACTCPDYHYRHRVCKHMVAADGGLSEKGAALSCKSR